MDSLSANYIYLILNDGGSSIIDGLTFNSLIIQNCVFKNLIVGTSSNIINTGSFQSLQILNSVFENISSQTSDDYGNIMIEIKSINLTSASDSKISNITIQNSVIGFIDFYTIVGSPNQTINFIISDIYYENWVIQNQLNLISFGSLQTQKDISFKIDNINFSNVTFLKYGNLLSFQQQITNILLLQNSNFQNLVSAFIYIEAANKQNLNITTKVRISNTTFTNINAQYGSLIQVNEGGYLEIDKSSFSAIYWFEEGSVLYAGSQRATVVITNSTFYNNTSLQGGVFNVDSKSVIKIYNWEISYNFGVVSGVIHADNNGYYEMYGSHIHHNYAVSSSVSQIYDVATIPIIDSCTLNDNYILNSTALLSELKGSWNLLWFLNTAFKNYLLANPAAYNIASSNKFFQLIQSSIQIRNQSKFYNGEGIVDSFISNVNITSSQFYNIKIADYCFKITTSNSSVSDSNFYNLTLSDASSLFQASFDSVINFSNASLINSQVSFATVLSAEMYASRVSISNVTSQSAILNLNGATGVVLQNLILNNLNSSSTYLIYLSQSSVASMINITVSNTVNSPLYVYSSNINLIDHFSARYWMQNIFIELSDIESISNSEFVYLGGSNLHKGGAVYIQDSNATISNSKFVNNTAISGGAIYFSCPRTNMWALTIQNSTFSNNIGIKNGGAI